MSNDKEAAARIALERYMHAAPVPSVLDMMESRRLRSPSTVGVTRQIAPGVYTWVERGSLVRLGGEK